MALTTATIAIATDPNVSGFRVFYDDGSFADSKGSPLSSLTLSLKKIQAVMVYEKGEYAPGKCYRRIYQGYALYMIDGIPLLGGTASNYDDAADSAMASETL